ncbi:hypothetical protein [Paenibacillus sp. P32E]|uniref:hypothetical protein n=1 Tax=Paenibacillus sp. P32E TaxID=1349434 RepID=UPI00093C2FCD|nr:hypothetical protein [Paenibacillus sp. P32E]OKP91395.1 hypothetical protein A3848_09835 [Paenibacillus sp. P32E]
MTQVKEMTNPELNRALAELMGYSIYHYDKDVEENCYYMLVDPTGDYQQLDRKTEAEAWADAPDYCTDPAASLEVQTAAIAKDKEAYIRNWLLCKYGKSITYYTSVSLPVAAEIADSNPRERSEAAYMVLSQVRE